MEMNGRIINQWWIVIDFEGGSYALTMQPLWHLPGGTEENRKKPQDSWYSKLDSSQASSNASLSVTATPHGCVKFFIQGLIHTDCHDRGCFLYHIKLYFLNCFYWFQRMHCFTSTLIHCLSLKCIKYLRNHTPTCFGQQVTIIRELPVPS
jgi:hypothetical protein